MIEIIIIILAVLVFLVLLFAGWIVKVYNFLAGTKQDVFNQFSNIKTEYQRRADLFYNLAEEVKGSAKFEKDTLTQVTEARKQANNLLNSKGSMKEQMKSMSGIENLFSKLMVVFERYPKLKATALYGKFMDETRITEDRINVARTDYNNIVNSYNTEIVSFPSNIVAGMFHFEQMPYFTNEEKTDYAPKLDLKI